MSTAAREFVPGQDLRSDFVVRAGSGPSAGVMIALVSLLATHCALLAYSATRHSPTMDEPGHLVAGISHWQYGRYEVYRVNPPLVRMVAALPVLWVGCKTDWTRFLLEPRSRCEFLLGDDFVRANGERSQWLFSLARWACIPFSVLGAIVAFLWSRDLWSHDGAGLLAAGLWCFEPNILAHAELITPDCGASAFGLAACFAFWRWLKSPSMTRAIVAGVLLGLAQLCKTTWIILFGLWPLIWLAWDGAPLLGVLMARFAKSEPGGPDRTHVSEYHAMVHWKPRLLQLAGIVVGSTYIVNFGYGFDGTLTRLGDFTFTCGSLTGLETGSAGNRFADTAIGNVPVPFPREFIKGIDVQRRDLENPPWLSYLRGRWCDHGWWYYYLYALAVKTTHGTQLLLGYVVTCFVITRLRARWPVERLQPVIAEERRAVELPSWRDLLALGAPAATVLILVSSQTGFNHHLRYVLPAFGFGFVFLGGAVRCWQSRPRLSAIVVFVCFVASTLSSLRVYPDSLTYFNEYAGGPAEGHKHLLGSNFDWGQDLVAFRDWAVRTESEIYLIYWGGVLPDSTLPADVAQRVVLPPQRPKSPEFLIAISQSYISGDNRAIITRDQGSLGVHRFPIRHFVSKTPIDRIGRTILVFRGSEEDFND